MRFIQPLVGCLVGAIAGVVFGCTSRNVAPDSLGMAASALTPTEQVESMCKGQFKNRGQCVSCVAHAVEQLRDQGMISEAEGGQIVSSFAQGACKDACIPTTCAIEGASCDNISDLCGGTLTCGTCNPPDTCVAGTCQPPLCEMVGTGPNHIVCQCTDFNNNVTTHEACGSCDTAGDTCSVVCGNFLSANSAVQECDQTTSCGGVPPPPTGPFLTACRCQNGTSSTVCTSTPAAICGQICANCGGLAQQTNTFSPICMSGL